MNIARLGITTSVLRLRNGHWRWAEMGMEPMWFRSTQEAMDFAQRYSTTPINWEQIESLDGLGYYRGKFTSFPLEVDARILEQESIKFHDGTFRPLPDPSKGDRVSWSAA